MDVLRLLPIEQNHARPNVTPRGFSSVRSVCLGKSAVSPACTKFSHQRWALFEFLATWLRTEAPHINTDFASIVINEGYAAALHRDDSSNVGPSVIRSLGTFSGGEILTYPGDDGAQSLSSLSIGDSVELPAHQFCEFAGRQAHQVLPFSGERFSLVF